MLRHGIASAIPASPLNLALTGRTQEPASAYFDGTTYLTRGASPTGLVDGKAATISFWPRVTADATTMYLIANATVTNVRFLVQRAGNNRWLCFGRNAANTAILSMSTNSTSHVASGGRRHVIFSFDLAAGTGFCYVDGASSLLAGATLTNDTIDFANGNFAIGADAAGNSKLSADVAELIFHPAFIDISVSANLQKFRTLDGRPAFLGQSGELPFGGQPLVYHSGPIADWATNKGSGGGMTVAAGALVPGIALG